MPSSSSEILSNAIVAAKETLASLAPLEPRIAQAADTIATCLTNGSKVLVCGNGGSAADAADFCTELACRFEHDRQPYPALNLSQGGSLLTATGNDYGFEQIFARQVLAFGKPGDVLLALSTSGQSKNIRSALEQAKQSRLKTIALLGRDGGLAAKIADLDLVVPGNSTARIQEGHKFILHVICEMLEPQLAKK